MIPVLQAEEALQQVTVAAIGGGLVEASERRRVLRAWERQAAGEHEAPRARPTKEQYLAQMAALGIGLVEG